MSPELPATKTFVEWVYSTAGMSLKSCHRKCHDEFENCHRECHKYYSLLFEEWSARKVLFCLELLRYYLRQETREGLAKILSFLFRIFSPFCGAFGEGQRFRKPHLEWKSGSRFFFS